MSAAPLTAEHLREVLEYDPETGVFRWRVAAGRWGRIPAGTVAGSVSKVHGYIHIHLDGVVQNAHRLAWLYTTGEWPKDQIDHVNRDRADNRFCNLREATTAQNMENKRRYRSNTSGHPGVHWRSFCGLWQARIGIAGKRVSLGHWPTVEEAAAAYVAAKAQMHPFGAKTA